MSSNATSQRRRFLTRAAVVASTLGFAGCLTGGSNSSSDGGPGTTTTDEDNPSPTSDTGTAEETTTETSSSPETSNATTESPRSVSFEAPHGATIKATAYGNGDCGIILVPQINLDRESWQPQAKMIADMGHLAFAIDEDPNNRPASVRGAIQYLRQQHAVSTLILIGASTGGLAVVVANAKTNATVDGTITLSAAGGTDYTSDLQGRSLFVVSKGDENRFVRIARQLHQRAPEPKKLVEYQGSAHGQRIFASDHGDDLRDRVRTFVSDVCGN